jgi:transcriptional regulator with XRE-family HTH domain
MTQKQVADALRWSSAKLMRIEAGKVRLSFTDLQALLKQYGVTGQSEIDDFTELLTAARSATGIGARYRDALSKEFAEFVENEEVASIIRSFQRDVIPGPLQTREYADAILTTNPEEPIAPEIREQRIRVRLERAALLTQDGAPDAFFVIDESAVVRLVGVELGDPTIMAAQLEHLRELGSRPNITIQFLPFSIGLYPGLRQPFVILEFEDAFAGGLVYIETPTEELIIREDIEQVARMIERFQLLEARATPPDALDAVIDRALKRIRESPSALL